MVLKSFNYVLNTLAYWNTDSTAEGKFGNTYQDPNAINVFLGTKSTTYVATNTLTSPSTTYVSSYDNGGHIHAGGVPGVFPKNWIAFNAQYDVIHPWGNCCWDNISGYGKTLAHEVCHVLGLNHATNNLVIPYQEVTYIAPYATCCTSIVAVDFVRDDGDWDTCPDVINPNTNNYGNGSNNVMSQNTACGYDYLSPQQMAAIHYNLRTHMKSVLTASSFTNALFINQNLNIDINSNQVWDAGARYLKGNLTVKTGKTLTIKCSVAMADGCKIFVEKGAQLVIDGGHVTNISGRTWDGIYVLGNPSLAQFQSHPTNSGAALYQGMLRIKAFGKISHAKVGARNNSGSGWDAGGIIITDNAIFENNLIDVEFNTLGTYSPSYSSASRFINTTFRTSAFIGTNQTPNTHAKLIKTDGVQFLGCNFQFTTTLYSSAGNGITSTDAIYIVNNFGAYTSTFDGLMKGIFVNNINPLKAPVITNTKFISPKSCGAYFMNADYLSFKTNTVQFHPTTYLQQAGVYLNNCKYYKISSNQFIQSNTITPADPGISIYKSQAGAHEVYRNEFSGLLMGINCMDNNSGVSNTTDGLKMNCNLFNTGQQNTYDIALTYTSGLAAPTVRKEQGKILSPSNFQVVRNVYGASCGNQNKWYVSSTSSKAIDHGSNTNSVTAITQPTPQPNCSNSLLNIVNANINLDYPVDCPINPLSSGGGGTSSAQNISNINNYISDLHENNQNNELDFEIQSSVSSKLNIFLSDTLGPNMDSVIAILNQNQGNMADADVQLVFAYILKHDFETATTKANTLQSTKPIWKTFFIKLIELETDTVEGIFILNSNETKRNFFINHSTTSNIDGQSNALALLQAACDSVYTEPHAIPEDEYQERPMNPANQNTAGVEDIQTDNFNFKVWIYPNPTSGDININVVAGLKQQLKYRITDVVGKRVISGQLIPNQPQEINTAQLSNGVYFVSVMQDNKVISKQKIILLK